MSATGGGAGGNLDQNGFAGGSGGGGSGKTGAGTQTGGAGTAGQGNNGGDNNALSQNRGGAGGGGGGGFNGVGGSGGTGYRNASPITLPTNGTNGLGGGGGGGGNSTGRSGGNGIVIVRWKMNSFSPLSLSPTLWLDASDTATITSSSTRVSAWADKSGNGNNLTQPTAFNQPTTGQYTQNGKNLMYLQNGGGQSQHFANVPLTVSSPFTVIMVLRSYDPGGRRGLWSSASKDVVGYGYDGATWNFYGQAGGVTSSANAVTGQMQLVSFNFNGAASSIRANKSTVGTGSVTQPTMSGFILGCGWVCGFEGAVGEVIIVDSALTESQAAAIENYLSTKWGTP